MKKIITFCLTFIFFLIGFYSFSQDFGKYFQSNNILVYDSNLHKYMFPFCGGIKFPVFTNYDFNDDGKQDLVVLDKSDEKILTFISTGKPGITEFVYQPQYEGFFPDYLTRYVYMKDYNRDGLPDLFSFSGAWGQGIDAYKNVGTIIKPVFQLIKFPLEAKYYTNPFETSIYVLSGDIPIFQDIDNDGDLDVITFKIAIGMINPIEFFLNISVEKYGNFDSLKFVFADQCWGKFYEGEDNNVLKLGISCPQVYTPSPDINQQLQHEKRHSGSTSMLLDIDGDDDMDLLIGDIGYPSITLLINGKKEYGWIRDTMIAQIQNFPTNTKAININDMPGVFYIDVNNDGIRDLIASPQDEDIYDTFSNLNQVWLYLNTGQDNHPIFEFNKNNFLQDEMIDAGGASSPAFFDYDNDSDQDLFIATKGDFSKTHYKRDHIILFENIGNANKPVFQLKNSDYLKLSSKNFQDISPAFGDLDGDGDKDLILGNINGKLIFYENVSLSGQKAVFTFVTNSLDNIDVGDYSTPSLFDFNQDSYTDILLGNKKGKISYFKNKGINGIPQFDKMTDSFGLINIKNAVYSSPLVCDLDNNGIPDLVLTYNSLDTFYAKMNGKVLFYKDISTNPGLLFSPVKNPFYDSVNSHELTKSLGVSLKPTAISLGNDKKPDLIIGSRRGGLMYFSSEYDSNDVGIPYHAIGSNPVFRIYPDPFSDYIHIEHLMLFHSEFELLMTDVTGKKLISIPLNHKIVQLNTTGISEGIYFVFIFNEQGKLVFRNKMIKY